MTFSRRWHGDEMVSSVIIMTEAQNLIKTGLGAEGEEKAILPSPDDCITHFYIYPANLSSEKTNSSGLTKKGFCRFHIYLFIV
jgi:hypothetical protein